MERLLFTIGHSTHSLPVFLGLLRRHAIAAVADVRSAPRSRRNPHFSREALERALHAEGVAYLFLGRELGARPEDPSCYRDGRVSYARLAATAAFRAGLDRVEEIAEGRRAALLCAEREPLACHRAILVSRHLAARGIAIRHILADGGLEAHDESERRLVRLLRLDQGDLFGADRDLVERAYELQGERISYARPSRADSRAGSDAAVV
jgi:uncharacterized protein (DUF488 family)